MGGLAWWHWLLIIAAAVMLFGAKRLPDAARGLGRSMRILKSEVSAMHNDDSEKDLAVTPVAVATPAGTAVTPVAAVVTPGDPTVTPVPAVVPTAVVPTAVVPTAVVPTAVVPTAVVPSVPAPSAVIPNAPVPSTAPVNGHVAAGHAA